MYYQCEYRKTIDHAISGEIFDEIDAVWHYKMLCVNAIYKTQVIGNII